MDDMVGELIVFVWLDLVNGKLNLCIFMRGRVLVSIDSKVL